jgi:two-component system response regulator HydG
MEAYLDFALVMVGSARGGRMKAEGLFELASFLETLPEPHILCDRNYRIVAANAAYRGKCAHFAQVLGKTCYEVSHRYTAPCDQSGEACPLARSLASGQRERAVHLHYGSGGELYESIDLSPVRNAQGEITHFVEKLEEMHAAKGLAHAQGLVGRSPAFQKMLELVARVAKSDANVLLQGESGTGKELVAQAVHDASPRSRAPFVVLDCSGMPEPLFESELFGYERGAFTGASARRDGLVEAASGGTLFLDEVGDIPYPMQVKLLRLLETGTYRRVGSTELRKTNFRLISATHQPMRRLVAEGKFRQDLFFRLSTFPIHLPSLSERREDIPLLAESLLARVTPRPLSISPEAMRLLSTYDYPGNIRELRNLLERASLLCDGNELQPEHLAGEASFGIDDYGGAGGFGATAEAPSGDDGVSLEELRRALVRGGTRRELARKLGLSERTLYRRLAMAKGGGDKQ